MTTTPTLEQDAAVARFLGQAIFASRWLLAPIYIGLSLSLIVLLIKFVQRTIDLFAHVLTTDASTTTIQILSLLELSFLASLVLIVMLAGYQNFVSEVMSRTGHRDKPEWIGRIGFGGLKLRLIASLVAISAIQLLEDFMHVGSETDRELGWTVGITLAFVVVGVLLAVTDRVAARSNL